MVIESTQIRNSDTDPLAFHFEVYEDEESVVVSDTKFDPHDVDMKDHSELQCHPVYTSRRTILDRPCWRDDVVTLQRADTRYEVRVLASRQGSCGSAAWKSEEMIYDTFKVGPMSHSQA